MQISQILPLYIGQKVKFNIIEGWANSGCIKEISLSMLANLERFGLINEVKPILRRMSSIRDEEKKEVYNVVFGRAFPNSGQIVWFDKEQHNAAKRWVLISGVDRLGIELTGDVWADCDLSNYKFSPHLVTLYFLSIGLDLFGLIDSGLAVDAATLKTKED